MTEIIYPDHDYWLQTCSDRVVDYLNPTPEQFDIEDIATALSQLCRFGGQSAQFYSVAQHSVLVSHLVPQEHALTALLHDATESVCCDVPRPLKRLLGTAYTDVEDRVWTQAIAPKYGLPQVMPAEVKAADNVSLFWEGHKFARRGWFLTQPFPEDVQAVVERVDADRWVDFLDLAQDPRSARRMFMARFGELV